MPMILLIGICFPIGLGLALVLGRLFGGIRTGEQTGKENPFWDGS